MIDEAAAAETLFGSTTEAATKPPAASNTPPVEDPATKLFGSMEAPKSEAPTPHVSRQAKLTP